MASKWTKKDVEILIPLYEQYTHLYDAKSKDYFNRVKRDDTYIKIAEKIAVNRKGTTIDDIKKKVKHLRIQYNQQKQLILKSQQLAGGAGGTGEIYVPKVWWFEKLKFLDSYRIERQNSSNINTTNLNPDSDISNFSNLDEESSEDLDNNLSDESVKYRGKTIKSYEKSVEIPSAIEPPKSIETQKLLQKIHLAAEAINLQKPNMTSKASAFTDFIAQQMNKLEDENIYSDLQDLLYKSVHDALKKDRNLKKKSLTSTIPQTYTSSFRDDCTPSTSRPVHRVSFSDKVTSISNTPPREINSCSHKKRKSNDKINSSDSVGHQKKIKMEMD